MSVRFSRTKSKITQVSCRISECWILRMDNPPPNVYFIRIIILKYQITCFRRNDFGPIGDFLFFYA